MDNIISERLIIRRFKKEDWQDLFEYLSDEEVVKFEPYDIYSEQQAKEEAVNRSNNECFYAVCLKESGKVIGNLYFGKGDFDTWELGYVFNRKYQGNGYASESSKALIDHAFENLGVRRIIALCSDKNERSWKLMERLGMRREGLFLQNVTFKTDDDGQPIWFNSYEYAILKSEWNK
ncbi:GNAT family N-acetyltransferase [Inconstantimicrobium mannanitabidum]|uniref:N-acetyltransferase YnaD n=1 Tax=Inconstantimicrobium mannanitabidum TaxID=1604901 RepID=A0ACB5RCU5_9CLOT|nr:GNAT family N-acetyltransferase [Clostridium sp. TW13]GKX66571.1 putative N-acetyltransferase YnaD [Clostridium sp. TW13]